MNKEAEEIKTRHPLRWAAMMFDFAEVTRLVKAGVRDDEAFLIDQGTTLCMDDENYADILKDLSNERNLPIEKEDHALFELYETLLQAGHPVPDDSTRRCLVRVIAGADPTRHERACAMMETCVSQGMLDWGTSEAFTRRRKALEVKGWNKAIDEALGGEHELMGCAMREAAKACNLPMLHVLSKGVNSQSKKEIALAALDGAARGGDIGCMKYLLELFPAETRVDRPFMTVGQLLPIAAVNKNRDLTRWMVENGFDINENTSGKGNGIIHDALRQKRPSMVPFLIELGAKVIESDPNAEGCLHLAAWHGYNDMIKLLLDHGLDIERLDGNPRMTPLLVASMVGNHEVVETLIKAGANIEARDWEGKTPALWAARNDRLEAFELLVHAGANLDVVSEKGETIREIAKHNVRGVLARLDREKMAADTQGAPGAMKPQVRM